MKTYQEMPLSNEVQKALTKLGFIKPTDVQKAVIPIATKGRDLMACAETGSGKTGAYGIPMIESLLDDPNRTALVLAPTRELAQQIADFLRELTFYCSQLKVVTLVGGADIRKQLSFLKKNPRIVVATPGRLTDHVHRKSINLDSTEILVLDEGDRMLDMGFAPQLNEILRYIPKKRQTLLFSATLPDKVVKLANKYLNKPEKITIGKISQPVATIKQSVIEISVKEKNDRILDELNQRLGSIIVFTRTKRRTDNLTRSLKQYGFDVDLIHGGRTQGQRNQALQRFKDGKIRILCATDVAARGIDVPQVEHVINFDLPMQEEDYVHRIGRTARNGAKGEAVSFVTPEDHTAWLSLVRQYKIKGVELKGKPAPVQADNNPKKKSTKRKKKRTGSLKEGFTEKREGKKTKKKFSNSTRSRSKKTSSSRSGSKKSTGARASR